MGRSVRIEWEKSNIDEEAKPEKEARISASEFEILIFFFFSVKEAVRHYSDDVSYVETELAKGRGNTNK